MSDILFATRLYQTQIAVTQDLQSSCLGIAREDRAGLAWSRAHNYDGYTSYASLDDLTRRASVFADLERSIAMHARKFARELEFDLHGLKLVLDSFWINVMNPDAIHAAHIHPHCVLSGTYYIRVPPRSGVIRFEDPRLAMMMAAPAKRKDARRQNRTFVDIAPKKGMLLLWESWLRHGVQRNRAGSARISVSFNYRCE